MTALPPHVETEIASRWERALPFFRERAPVVFASYCRFWEAHGFVQQSLAKTLAGAGVEVVWLDGAGWREYQPVLPFEAPSLVVRQAPSLPGRRIPLVDRLAVTLEADAIRRALGARGARALFWVQAGIDERVVERLPYVDVYSVFDDPYRHAAGGPLCRRASLVLCQSSFTVRVLADLGKKARLALPPVDLAPEAFRGAGVTTLPPGFPERVAGYLGSFYPASFDFALLEELVRMRPDWGFLLMGRTDGDGLAAIERLRGYRNFCHLPWVPRASVASAWRLLDVTLLPYKEFREQDGAFATKALESLHFGVPVLATKVAKTEDLAPWFPRESSPAALAGRLDEVAAMGDAKLGEAYAHFAYEMHPKLHLARVAEALAMTGRGVV